MSSEALSPLLGLSECCQDDSGSSPALPYLRGWVLVGPEGSVSHDDPILVQGEREGLRQPQPSPPGSVLDLRNALSDQRVQILNVLQD